MQSVQKLLEAKWGGRGKKMEPSKKATKYNGSAGDTMPEPDVGRPSATPSKVESMMGNQLKRTLPSYT